MSPGVAAKKRLGGGGGGFALGCGCKDAKAVAVSASASPYSPTETSTATTATWRRARTHLSASVSTGTLTVPSASSSFLWEDAEADADEEVEDCKRQSSETTPSFSGLLRQLNELEQSVITWGRKSPRSDYFSPPLPLLPLRHRIINGGDKCNSKEGQGHFSPPTPPPSFPFPPHQHRKTKSVDKGNSKEGGMHFMSPPPPPLPLPPQKLRNVKSMDNGNRKENGNHFPPPQAPQHRKAKSCDNNDCFGGCGGRGSRGLDGSVAVVKQSEDPLGDFRRSMLQMIVENGIVTGDELREMLRRFLSLNATHHHDAIIRAFAEIWDEVFAAAAPHHEPSRPPPRQRTPPRRRHPPPAWRV